jgi:uncharacterized membrane protein
MLLIYWDKFPAEVPFHWNFQGAVDDWAPKEIGLLIGPAINIVMYFLFLLLPRLDPGGANYKFFQNSYKALRLTIAGFLFFLFILVFLSGLGQTLDIGRLVIYFTLIFFLIVGNFLSTFRSNWFVGIRTPWTLSSNEVWVRTHRMAGRLWVTSTLIMLFAGFFIPTNLLTIAYFSYVALIILVPIVYSYMLYKKLEIKNSQSI